MFKEEFKKLFVKQFGLVLTIAFIIGEMIFVNSLYQKREFTSEDTERYFYEYMDNFSGRLTPEKESGILAEQERIVDAQNAQAAIEKRLLYGEYESEEEFLAEYEKYRAVTERDEAFQILFEQYSYAKGDPQNRYIMSGKYDGLGADMPDVCLLSLIIVSTAFLFLSEENSCMITFIRISENGKRKTFGGKIASILMLILFGWIFSVLSQFLVMILRGNYYELGYPLRTIEFFQSCPYHVTILQGFLAISVFRLLGYLFVSALMILLSAAVRKALPVIFIPCAVCLLQQFAFNPATPAYYIPTGFLRGVGYFRGDVLSKTDSGDEVKIFSQIPLPDLLILIILTLTFIIVSIVVGYNYYTCKPKKKFFKKFFGIIAVISVCVTFSGCTNEQDDKIIYNLQEGTFLAQNEDSFFLSRKTGIFKVSKIDDTESQLLRDVFENDQKLNVIALCGDCIYYNSWFGELNVKKLSLNDYDVSMVISNNSETRKGFLNLNVQSGYTFPYIVTGVFSDNDSVFIVFDNSLFLMKNGRTECLINKDIYNQMLCFDGQKIYYINSILQLRCYDTKTNDDIRLPGELVRAVYYDGTRLLFSDRSGIFAVNLSDFSAEKISDQAADMLCSDGERIAYSHDGRIYLLAESPVEICSNSIKSFGIVSGTNRLIVQNADLSSEIIVLPIS